MLFITSGILRTTTSWSVWDKYDRPNSLEDALVLSLSLSQCWCGITAMVIPSDTVSKSSQGGCQAMNLPKGYFCTRLKYATAPPTLTTIRSILMAFCILPLTIPLFRTIVILSCQAALSIHDVITVNMAVSTQCVYEGVWVPSNDHLRRLTVE